MTKKEAQISGVATRAIHSAYTAPDGFGAFPVAIHHASTVLFDSVAAMRSRSWLSIRDGRKHGRHLEW